MDAVKNEIQGKLRETESQRDVRIPLAVESGSRGWGFPSPDSDYDCRFVYARRRDWYLSVFDRPDTIEYAAGPVFDINGWDIRKVLRHIEKSNAVMFEWLSSNEVYVKDETVAGLLTELAVSFFNPVAVSRHYLGIVKKKLDEIRAGDSCRLKTYFYIFRPLANLEFIRQYNRMPYMEYFKTLSEIETPADILREVRELAALKKVSDEGFSIKKNGLLVAYLQSEAERHEKWLACMKYIRNRDYERVDTVFKQILERVWGDG